MGKHNRILVIRTDRIGDVVLTTPLIRALKRTFPSAHLAAMVRPYAEAVLAGNPHLDEVILDESGDADAGTAGFCRQVRSLRQRRFDTALLLLPTRRLAWMLFFAGIPLRIGVGSKPYQLLTCMQTVSRQNYVPLRHEADYCMDLGRKIGVDDDDLSVEVFVGDEERRAAREIIAERAGGDVDSSASVLVGIHVGSGRSAPNWRVDRYVELAELLLQDDRVRIGLTGAPEESHLIEPFRAAGRDRMIDLTGLPLRSTTVVISQLSALVSASTGPMHIAAGLRVPTVSLFCPLSACSPELWGPRGNTADVILPAEGYCQGRCPGDPHVCDFEDGIHPRAVADRVMKLLGRSLTRS